MSQKTAIQIVYRKNALWVYTQMPFGMSVFGQRHETVASCDLMISQLRHLYQAVGVEMTVDGQKEAYSEFIDNEEEQ